MENNDKSPIVEAPDSSGYWWWRKDSNSRWVLADVDDGVQFKARFFDGSRILDTPYGQWAKAQILPVAEDAGLRVDSVKIVWRVDEVTGAPDPETCLVGCFAVAEVSYPINGVNGDRRIETLKSGGLWGIDAKSPADYRKEIEREQLDGLAEHLKVFGVRVKAPLVATA